MDLIVPDFYGRMRGATSALRIGSCILACALAAACAAPVGVRPLDHVGSAVALTGNVLTTEEPGAYSNQLLYRLGLKEAYGEDPRGVLAELHAGLGGPDEPARLFALAELSYDHAEKSGDRRYHLAAALYAYALLFPDGEPSQLSRYDARMGASVDLYNRGIVYGLQEADGGRVDLTPRSVELPFGTVELSSGINEFPFGSERLAEFEFMGDFELYGLRNEYRRPGVGASLAAHLATDRFGVDRPWLPPAAKLPATLVLRFDDPHGAFDGGTVRGRLDLYDPYKDRETEIGHERVPLSVDTSAVLAYRLDDAPVWDMEIAGFRRGDFRIFADQPDALLLFMQPYYPGRIPLVLVHGTASSPGRWADLANEVLADSVLGERYQIWIFLYHTGNPILLSAADLRENLLRARTTLDPEGADAALDRMVVVGHSQGGLLTRLLAVDSGNHFWRNASERDFADVELDPTTRELFARAMFFEPVAPVDRLIFVCTPHRGSFLAGNFLGRLARRMITLPARFLRVGADLARMNPGAAARELRIPTSVDNMEPGSPFLQALDAAPMDPSVPVHSIVAVREKFDVIEEGNDGVVAYESAHFEDAASEVIVRSVHSAQAHPDTVEEIRRVLYEHLAADSVESVGETSGRRDQSARN